MRQTRGSLFLPLIGAARATVLVLAAAAFAPGARAADPARKSPDADLKFAREMASQGLWREAMFRWERALAALPPDSADAGRIHNNIGVAAEALGQLEKARASYEKAAALTRDKQVVSNYELFRRAHAPSRPEDRGGGETTARGTSGDAGNSGERTGAPPTGTAPPGPAGPGGPGPGPGSAPPGQPQPQPPPVPPPPPTAPADPPGGGPGGAGARP